MYSLLYVADNFSDFGPLVLRIAVGMIFLVHGLGKFKMWKMPASEQSSGAMSVMMKILSIVESLAGLAILVGYFTQLAAAVVGVVMFGALYFKIFVWRTPFTAMDKTGWEFDFLILAASVALFLMGPGAVSVDWFYLFI